MILITLLLSLMTVSSQEEWLKESSLPVEYPIKAASDVTELSEEIKPQEALPKTPRAKYLSKRPRKSPK